MVARKGSKTQLQVKPSWLRVNPPPPPLLVIPPARADHNAAEFQLILRKEGMKGAQGSGGSSLVVGGDVVSAGYSDVG